jgi:hypothetical protein
VVRVRVRMPPTMPLKSKSSGISILVTGSFLVHAVE